MNVHMFRCCWKSGWPLPSCTFIAAEYLELKQNWLCHTRKRTGAWGVSVHKYFKNLFALLNKLPFVLTILWESHFGAHLSTWTPLSTHCSHSHTIYSYFGHKSLTSVACTIHQCPATIAPSRSNLIVFACLRLVLALLSFPTLVAFSHRPPFLPLYGFGLCFCLLDYGYTLPKHRSEINALKRNPHRLCGTRVLHSLRAFAVVVISWDVGF